MRQDAFWDENFAGLFSREWITVRSPLSLPSHAVSVHSTFSAAGCRYADSPI